MSRTWLSIFTATILVSLSVGIMIARRSVLGSDLDGPRGTSAWRINLVIAGQAEDKDKPRSITVGLPPDFRRQHIIEEKPRAGDVRASTNGKSAPYRELHWEGTVKSPTAYRLTWSFRAILGMRQPSGAMRKLTRKVDAPPVQGAYLQSEPLIQNEEKAIVEQSRALTDDARSPLQQVRAFYDFVSRLEYEPTLQDQSALTCLELRSGDAAGKNRLLVGLCRAAGIPARLVTGLILGNSRSQQAHLWAEAWVNQSWMPLCPTYHFFGSELPANYLVLHLARSPWLQSRNARLAYVFQIESLGRSLESTGESPPSPFRTFFQKISLFQLAPQEQSLVRFLLLLPPAALIVSFFRIVVGLPTFGTYGPALLGLAFLDWSTLPWGIAAFVSIVLVGWGLRRVLDSYRLLMVPRTSALLTLIVIFLILVTVITSQFGIPLTRYLSLFPLVILTHMVERFWTVEAEDGTSTSLKTLVSTLIVTVTISLAMAPRILTVLLFRHPELLGIVLAATLLLGRYTGYRLSELRRFRDLIQGSEPPKSSAS